MDVKAIREPLEQIMVGAGRLEDVSGIKPIMADLAKKALDALSAIDPETIRAEARAELDELLEALDGVIDFAEDWHEHYCAMWGERQKEQQDAMLGAILKARAALAEKEEQDGR